MIKWRQGVSVASVRSNTYYSLLSESIDERSCHSSLFIIIFIIDIFLWSFIICSITLHKYTKRTILTGKAEQTALGRKFQQISQR